MITQNANTICGNCSSTYGRYRSHSSAPKTEELLVLVSFVPPLKCFVDLCLIHVITSNCRFVQKLNSRRCRKVITLGTYHKIHSSGPLITASSPILLTTSRLSYILSHFGICILSAMLVLRESSRKVLSLSINATVSLQGRIFPGETLKRPGACSG